MARRHSPVIARSEATKQSRAAALELDCFASLAMTSGKAYNASTVTTPVTALMAPAICGETLKRPAA